MPNLTISIPAALVPDLTVIAEDLFEQRKINTTGMTPTQKGQRFIVELLRDQIIKHRSFQAGLAAQVATKTVVDEITG